ncbi:MAG: hypothetical protein Q4B26_04775 [Eubacteriales bacterium]|nr:hypothetical protein [Eubacteriales bacterium]
MEEYTQLTLDDWLIMKDSLKQDLAGVAVSFVRIGYKLRQIEEQKLYEKDGHKSIAEFAAAEYGLTASTVSRFIAINKKYSIDGYSEQLQPEYALYGSSKLSEMLTLPDSDMEMVSPEMKKTDIRELKAFNKEIPSAEEADELDKVIRNFFKDNLEIYKELRSKDLFSDVRKAKDLINPSGSRVYRKGLFFLAMQDGGIKVKKFRENPQDLTWEEFLSRAEALEDMGQAAEEPEPTEKDVTMEASKQEEPQEVLEVHEEVQKEVRTEAKNDHETNTGDSRDAAEDPAETELEERNAEVEKAPEETEKISQEESEEKNPAAEQYMPKPVEVPEKESEEDSGEGSETGSVTISDSEKVEPEKIAPAQEILDKPFGTRKDYLDSLTAFGAAEYLCKETREGNMRAEWFSSDLRKLETYLREIVDEKGNTL